MFANPRTSAAAMVLIVGPFLVGSPAHAMQRKVWDCSFGSCLLNFHSLSFNYTFGRSEGMPARGPVPVGPVPGLTDTDKLYDFMALINDYYLAKFGRNGPNGYGGLSTGLIGPLDEMAGFVHADPTYYKAYMGWPRNNVEAASSSWRGSVTFGGGFVVPDIVGHEMFHFVTRTNWKNPDGSWQVNPDGTWVNLGWTGESGTLDEGMSDFFGEAFELWLTGSTDWQMVTGVDLVRWGESPRNLADPPSTSYHVTATGVDVPYPDRYLSPNFYVGSEDNGGTHRNSTIIGKAAYLASDGGSFNGFEIAGLGIEKVEQIFYRAVTEYFEPGETFNLVYEDFIQAASDLYAQDVWELTKALRAVELNMPRDFRGDFNSDGFIDAADYVAWRKGLGATWSLATFDIWKAHFGEAAGIGTAVKSGVPESTSVAILFLGTTIMFSRLARRQST